MKKDIWEKIRLDYEIDGISIKDLSQKYKIHRNSISVKKKKDGWIKHRVKKEIAKEVQKEVVKKFEKDIDEIYTELDLIHELATKGIKLRLLSTQKKGKVVDENGEIHKLPTEGLDNIEKGAKALALIRRERASIREKLIYEDLLKNNLDIEKLKETRATRKEKTKIEKEKNEILRERNKIEKDNSGVGKEIHDMSKDEKMLSLKKYNGA